MLCQEQEVCQQEGLAAAFLLLTPVFGPAGHCDQPEHYFHSHAWRCTAEPGAAQQ